MIQKHILAAGLALAALCIGSAAALAAPAEATASVNVRSGPGGSFKQVGKLAAGELVEVNECQKGWCFVERDAGANGWVSASYLLEVDDYEPAPKPPKPGPKPKPIPAPAPAPVDPQINFGVTIGPDGKPTINFGVNQPKPQPQFPKPQPPKPQPPKPKPNPPTVCFYDKANFGGKSFCAVAGTNQPVLPPNWDDRISSVEVLNGATVDMCTEANGYGYCGTYTKSRPTLPGKLDDDTSSFEVY